MSLQPGTSILLTAAHDFVDVPTPETDSTQVTGRKQACRVLEAAGNTSAAWKQFDPLSYSYLCELGSLHVFLGRAVNRSANLQLLRSACKTGVIPC